MSAPEARAHARNLSSSGSALTRSARSPSVDRTPSASRSWRIGSRDGERIVLPADLLVARDGVFPISAEVTGTLSGRTIRRAISYRLEVGAQRERPIMRNGAYEFAGRADAGGR